MSDTKARRKAQIVSSWYGEKVGRYHLLDDGTITVEGYVTLDRLVRDIGARLLHLETGIKELLSERETP